ncbi:hypothetical protein F511_18921, partial [Dorcoceras hygrometricum]
DFLCQNYVLNGLADALYNIFYEKKTAKELWESLERRYKPGCCEPKNSLLASTRSVLGKWVYLVTLAMSLFDLQDVCMAIGSIATLDLPMVVDLIGIYVLKGPYFYANHDQLPPYTHTRPPPFSADHTRRRRPPPRAAASCQTCSGHRDEEFPSVLNPSSLLVQIDGGRLNPVVDLIGGSTAAYREEPVFL